MKTTYTINTGTITLLSPALPPSFSALPAQLHRGPSSRAHDDTACPEMMILREISRLHLHHNRTGQDRAGVVKSSNLGLVGSDLANLPPSYPNKHSICIRSIFLVYPLCLTSPRLALPHLIRPPSLPFREKYQVDCDIPFPAKQPKPNPNPTPAKALHVCRNNKQRQPRSRFNTKGLSASHPCAGPSHNSPPRPPLSKSRGW